MVRAYLGLGANVPPEEERLMEALARLSQGGLRIGKVSSLYRTEPWGRGDQPWFTNLAVEADTHLSPRALLALCQRVERDLGRMDRGRWGPRELDIDILLYGGEVIDEPDLIVPHPRLPERRFALVPLAEIAPEVRHPVLGRAIAELLAEVRDSRRVLRLKGITS